MHVKEMLKKLEGGRLSSGPRMPYQELGCFGPSCGDLQAQMVMLIFLDQIHIWGKAQALCKLLQERESNLSSSAMKSLGCAQWGIERWKDQVVVMYLSEKGTFRISTQICPADAMLWLVGSPSSGTALTHLDMALSNQL